VKRDSKSEILHPGQSNLFLNSFVDSIVIPASEVRRESFFKSKKDSGQARMTEKPGLFPGQLQMNNVWDLMLRISDF
jgi:hypothetical protein